MNKVTHENIVSKLRAFNLDQWESNVYQTEMMETTYKHEKNINYA